MTVAGSNRELVVVRVKPRSARAGMEVTAAGGLVVCVHAPAAENAANEECRAVVARALDRPKSAVTIVRGQKSRTKQLSVAGLTPEEVRRRLELAARGEMA